MAVNYVCSACGRNWDADEYRDDLDCPECNGRLVPQDKAKGAATPAAPKPVNPTIPNSPPAFKGLKVARPVGSLGSRRPTSAAPPAPAAAEADDDKAREDMRKNLAAEQPEIVGDMSRRITNFLGATNARLPAKNPDLKGEFTKW